MISNKLFLIGLLTLSPLVYPMWKAKEFQVQYPQRKTQKFLSDDTLNRVNNDFVDKNSLEYMQVKYPEKSLSLEKAFRTRPNNGSYDKEKIDPAKPNTAYVYFVQTAPKNIKERIAKIGLETDAMSIESNRIIATSPAPIAAYHWAEANQLSFRELPTKVKFSPEFYFKLSADGHTIAKKLLNHFSDPSKVTIAVSTKDWLKIQNHLPEEFKEEFRNRKRFYTAIRTVNPEDQEKYILLEGLKWGSILAAAGFSIGSALSFPSVAQKSVITALENNTNSIVNAFTKGSTENADQYLPTLYEKTTNIKNPWSDTHPVDPSEPSWYSDWKDEYEAGKEASADFALNSLYNGISQAIPIVTEIATNTLLSSETASEIASSSNACNYAIGGAFIGFTGGTIKALFDDNLGEKSISEI